MESQSSFPNLLSSLSSTQTTRPSWSALSDNNNNNNGTTQFLHSQPQYPWLPSSSSSSSSYDESACSQPFLFFTAASSTSQFNQISNGAITSTNVGTAAPPFLLSQQSSNGIMTGSTF